MSRTEDVLSASEATPHGSDVVLGRVSGAHRNPAVTFVLWVARLLSGRHVPLYVRAQLAGSVAGVVLGRLTAGAPLSHPDVEFALLSPLSRCLRRS